MVIDIDRMVKKKLIYILMDTPPMYPPKWEEGGVGHGGEGGVLSEPDILQILQNSYYL